MSTLYHYLKYGYSLIQGHQSLAQIVVAVLFLLIGLFGAFAIAKITGILHHRLERFTPRWLQIFNRSFAEPIVFIIRAVLIYLFVRILPLPESLSGIYPWVDNIFAACVIAFLGLGFWRSEALCGLLLSGAQNQLEGDVTNRTMIRFFEKIYRALVLILTILSILEVFGIPVAGLLAGAGVAGLAVSLACQSTFSSLIAGIALVLEHPFGIGDFVRLGNYSGTIQEVSFRSTKILTLDNVLLTIENSQICSSYIENLSKRENRLLNYSIGVRYDTTTDQLRSLTADLMAGIEQDPAVVKGTAHVAVTEFRDFSVTLDVRVYVTSLLLNEYRDTQDRLNLLTMDLVEKNGCEFAFPSNSIYMEPPVPEKKEGA